MKITAILDNNTAFNKVIIRSTYSGVSPTPHCVEHGAMNKVSVTENGGGYWRCIGTVSKGNENCCRAGCNQIK